MAKRVLNTYLLMWGIERYVVSGAVAGLTAVAWHDESAAFTDGSTIHLPRPNCMWSDEELLIWRYKAEHELGHEDAINSNPHWKEVMVAKKKDPKYKDDGLLWWLSNLISDHVQEHNRIGEMIGRDEVLLEGRANFLKNEVFKDKATDKAKPDMQDSLGLGVFLWDTESRMKWNPHITSPVIKDKAAVDFKERIIREGEVDLTKLENEEQVFEAACKIRKLFPEIPPTNNFMNVLGDEKGDPSAGEKGEGKKCKTGKNADKMDELPPYMANGYHSDTPKRGDYSYRESKNGVYVPRIPVNLRNSRRGERCTNHRHVDNVKSILKKTNLPSKVRQYLMAMQREKYTTGWRSGRLDTGRLTDVLRGKDDLFRRKEPVMLVDSAVSLLVDSSGSMSGRPFEHACASALMLAEALQGIKVSVEIAGFTEFGSGPKDLVHDLWLPFGQRFVRENVLKEMGKISSCLSNNVDGENILYAYNRLMTQKQTRKILIVLSDGEPAGSGPEGRTIGPGQFTKNVCESIEADKRCLLVGLGMSGYSPDRFYKNAYHVEYGEALEPVLLKIVQDAVLRK